MRLFSSVYPQYSVSSYTSLNERLASVNNGIIKAEGEKGTTYIKMQTTAGVVWVKVVVGSDQLDLWYNFHSLIDCDYKTITDKLGTPNLTGDKYSFGYRFDDTHETAVELDIFINKNSNTVEQMSLLLKNTVPTSKILSYLDSRYYLVYSGNGAYVYSSSDVEENSIALIQYEPDRNLIGYFSLSQKHTQFLWDDYSSYIGMNTADVKNILGKPSIDLGTNLQYAVANNDYIDMVIFLADPKTNIVYQASLIIKNNANLQEILNNLEDNYIFSDNRSYTDINYFVYTDNNDINRSSKLITFDAYGLYIVIP